VRLSGGPAGVVAGMSGDDAFVGEVAPTLVFNKACAYFPKPIPPPSLLFDDGLPPAPAPAPLLFVAESAKAGKASSVNKLPPDDDDEEEDLLGEVRR